MTDSTRLQWLRGVFAAVCLMSGAAFLGCGGGTSVAVHAIPVEGKNGRFSVDSSGGVFEVIDSSSDLYGVSLEIPRNAMSSGVTITVGLAEDEFDVPDAASISNQYEIRIEGGANTDLPITVRIPVTQDITESSSVIVLSKSGNDWHMPYVVGYDDATGKAFAVADQFSIFGAFISEPSSVSVDFLPSSDGFREYDNDGFYLDSSGKQQSGGTCYGVSWFLNKYWQNYRPKCGVVSDFMSGGDGWSLDDEESSISVYIQRQYTDDALFGLQFGDLLDFFFDKVKPADGPFVSYIAKLLSISRKPVLLVLIVPGVGNHAVLAYAYDASVPGRVLIYDPNYPGQESYLDCSLILESCTYYDKRDPGNVKSHLAFPVVMGDGSHMDRIARSDDFMKSLLDGALACKDVCRDYYYQNGDEERSCADEPDGQFTVGPDRVTCFNADGDSCLEGVESRCGDGKCSIVEDSTVCSQDCSCVPDCTGLECGPDPVCGQSCGTCDDGYSCQGGDCVLSGCVPDCGQRVCGPDPLCGMSCGNCASDEYCTDWGQCEPVEIVWFTDPGTGLTWENPPQYVDFFDSKPWAGWESARNYCESLNFLGASWRLPTIEELRTLVDGCPATASDGVCGVGDDCLMYMCADAPCGGCEKGSGSDDGCYWVREFDGKCSDSNKCYWTLDWVDGCPNGQCVWCVYFDTGMVSWALYNDRQLVRCVKDKG